MFSLSSPIFSGRQHGSRAPTSTTSRPSPPQPRSTTNPRRNNRPTSQPRQPSHPRTGRCADCRSKFTLNQPFHRRCQGCQRRWASAQQTVPPPPHGSFHSTQPQAVPNRTTTPHPPQRTYAAAAAVVPRNHRNTGRTPPPYDPRTNPMVLGSTQQPPPAPTIPALLTGSQNQSMYIVQVLNIEVEEETSRAAILSNYVRDIGSAVGTLINRLEELRQGVRTNAFPCQGCSQSFEFPEARAAHVIEVHCSAVMNAKSDTERQYYKELQALHDTHESQLLDVLHHHDRSAQLIAPPFLRCKNCCFASADPHVLARHITSKGHEFFIGYQTLELVRVSSMFQELPQALFDALPATPPPRVPFNPGAHLQGTAFGAHPATPTAATSTNVSAATVAPTDRAPVPKKKASKRGLTDTVEHSCRITTQRGVLEIPFDPLSPLESLMDIAYCQELEELIGIFWRWPGDQEPQNLRELFDAGGTVQIMPVEIGEAALWNVISRLPHIPRTSTRQEILLRLIMAGIEQNPGPPKALFKGTPRASSPQSPSALQTQDAEAEDPGGGGRLCGVPRYPVVAVLALLVLVFITAFTASRVDWLAVGVPSWGLVWRRPYFLTRLSARRLRWLIYLDRRHRLALVRLALMHSIHPNPGPENPIHSLVKSLSWGGEHAPPFTRSECLDFVKHVWNVESCPLSWDETAGCKTGIYRSQKFVEEHSGFYLPCNANRLCVVDIDHLNEHTTELILAASEDKCRAVVLTPRGAHLYFRSSPVTSSCRGDGFDIKCCSGPCPTSGDIVLCPPSSYYKSGESVSYTWWRVSSELTPPSVRLLDAITLARDKRGRPRKPTQSIPKAVPSKIQTLDRFLHPRTPLTPAPSAQRLQPEPTDPNRDLPVEDFDTAHEESSLLGHTLGIGSSVLRERCPACQAVLSTSSRSDAVSHLLEHLGVTSTPTDLRLRLVAVLNELGVCACHCGFQGSGPSVASHRQQCHLRWDPARQDPYVFRVPKALHNWRTLDHIPVHLRQRVAAMWGAEIRTALHRNDESSWNRALLFPTLVLKQCPDLSARLDLWNEGKMEALCPQGSTEAKIKPPRKKGQKFSSERATFLAGEGNYRKAVESLTQGEKVIPDLASSFKMKSLHPQRREAPKRPEPNLRAPAENLKKLFNLKPPRVTSLMVRDALNSFSNGSSAGPTQLKAAHLKELVLGDPSGSFLETLTELVQKLIDGELSEHARNPLANATLIGIAKKQGGIRPIAIGEVLRRLAGKVLVASLRKELGEILKPHQFGFGRPGGAACLIHEVRHILLSLDVPEAVLAKLDFSNAFNSIDRQLVLDAVALYAPALLPYTWWLYGVESNLHFGEFNISSSQGVQQGDPLGPVLFSLALLKFLQGIDTSGTLFQGWYLDDGNLIAPPEVISRLVGAIREEGLKVGFVLNETKSEIIFLRGFDNDILPSFSRPGRNFSLLGTPFGTRESIQAFVDKEVLQEAALICEALAGFNQSHVAYTLLRQCVSFSRLVHLMRTVDPEDLRPSAKSFDDMVQGCLLRIIGTPVHPMALKQSALRIADGGLGLRRCESHLDCAFVAGAKSASSESPVEDEAYDRALARLRVSLKCELSDPGELSIQRLLSLRLDTLAKADHLESLPSVEQRAHFQCVSQGSGNFLLVIPSPALRLRIPDLHFKSALKWWLRAPLSTAGKCPRCNNYSDDFGYHSLTCHMGGDITIRHNAIRNVVFEAARQGAMNPKIEISVIPGSNERHADLLLPDTVGTVCDFAVTHPLQKQYVSNVAKQGPMAAVDHYALTHKVTPFKDRVEALGYQYSACVCDAFGNWNQSGKDILMAVARALASRDDRPMSAHYSALLQRCSVVLVLWNMRAIMGRWNPRIAVDDSVPQNAVAVDNLIAGVDKPKTNLEGLSAETVSEATVHR